MNDLVKKIPIELTNLLNLFNEDLSDRRNLIEMNASEASVILNKSNYNAIKIKYQLKKTNFFFEIEFIPLQDYVKWSYYPHSTNSTKEKKRDIALLAEVIKRNELLDNLRQWKYIINETDELENPLNFFKTDPFIKFYAGEFIEEIQIDEEDKNRPLTSKQRAEFIELIKKQSDFLAIELSNIKDDTSEKFQDLTTSQRILTELSENIPRMTTAQVKQNWAISLGAIRKWCEDQFIKFLNIDKNTKYDLSRSLGSFIGGVFGIPKLDE